MFSSACASNLVDLSMSLSKSRKRSCRYRVKCEECEKEFDSDYVEYYDMQRIIDIFGCRSNRSSYFF